MLRITNLHLLKRKEQLLNPNQPTLLSPTKQESEEIEKEEYKEEHKNIQKFSRLIEKSKEVLIELHTVFPFDLFPDKITIDPVKINYRCNIFFSSGYTESIPILDITNVVVESAIFFSALRISFISYPTRQLLIKPLWRKDAEKARDIIAGLIITHKQYIDVSKAPYLNPSALQTVGMSHT